MSSGITNQAALSLVNLGTRRGPFWQPRYHDSICRHARNFGDKLEYIHNNPVEANLVSRPEDWPWSSAGWYANHSRPPIPVDPIDIPSDPDAFFGRHPGADPCISLWALPVARGGVLAAPRFFQGGKHTTRQRERPQGSADSALRYRWGSDKN
jgi:hypothetical protein